MATLEREPAFSGPFLNTSFGKYYYFVWKILARGYCMHVFLVQVLNIGSPLNG
jgi:hypothetical protein